MESRACKGLDSFHASDASGKGFSRCRGSKGLVGSHVFRNAQGERPHYEILRSNRADRIQLGECANSAGPLKATIVACCWERWPGAVAGEGRHANLADPPQRAPTQGSTEFTKR